MAGYNVHEANKTFSQNKANLEADGTYAKALDLDGDGTISNWEDSYSSTGIAGINSYADYETFILIADDNEDNIVTEAEAKKAKDQINAEYGLIDSRPNSLGQTIFGFEDSEILEDSELIKAFVKDVIKFGEGDIGEDAGYAHAENAKAKAKAEAAAEAIINPPTDKYSDALDLDGDKKNTGVKEQEIFKAGINTYENYTTFIFIADGNKDGIVEEGEINKAIQTIDKDKDGTLEIQELLQEIVGFADDPNAFGTGDITEDDA